MNEKVAIIGIGYTIPAPISPRLSYKEMTFQAARMAYEEAGITPAEVDSFVSVAEDLTEGTSIFDEYVPDQIGAVRKPVHTITGDGIQGIIAGCLQILTGALNLVVVEGHSKASNITTPTHILDYALDPVLNRPLGLNPYFVAGLEMQRYLKESGISQKDCAGVVAKNKQNATRNRLAPFGATITPDEVLNSPPVFEPIHQLHLCPHSDAAYVIVLASESLVKKRMASPVWLIGMGWNSDSPALETRDWATAISTKLAAENAYHMANINDPTKQIDVFEIDDSFGYKELQHRQALGIVDSNTNVNLSGGALGVGWMNEATGLHKVLEIVLQLRQTASPLQVEKARTGLAQSWRGIPTTTSAVLILKR